MTQNSSFNRKTLNLIKSRKSAIDRLMDLCAGIDIQIRYGKQCYMSIKFALASAIEMFSNLLVKQSRKRMNASFRQQSKTILFYAKSYCKRVHAVFKGIFQASPDSITAIYEKHKTLSNCIKWNVTQFSSAIQQKKINILIKWNLS